MGPSEGPPGGATSTRYRRASRARSRPTGGLASRMHQLRCVAWWAPRSQHGGGGGGAAPRPAPRRRARGAIRETATPSRATSTYGSHRPLPRRAAGPSHRSAGGNLSNSREGGTGRSGASPARAQSRQEHALRARPLPGCTGLLSGPRSRTSSHVPPQRCQLIRPSAPLIAAGRSENHRRTIARPSRVPKRKTR